MIALSHAQSTTKPLPLRKTHPKSPATTLLQPITARSQPSRPFSECLPHAFGAALAASLILTASPLIAPPAHAQTLGGMARAVDGDTLEVAGTRIRLFGMDAPEKAQFCKTKKGADYPCGQVSMDALKAQVAKGPVKCNVRDKDQYGRTVASCTLATGEDVGEYMVKNGLAVAYRQYSQQYIPLEEAAKQAQRGIWQGPFEMPAQWRKQTKAQEAMIAAGMVPAAPAVASLASPAGPPAGPPAVVKASQMPPNPGCAIKGNISSSGERIYHVQGGQYYESTVIEPDKGEKWFCSEQEATAAGWRKAVR